MLTVQQGDDVMNRFVIAVMTAGCLVAATASPVLAGDGVGEQIGRKIDRGLNELTNELREGWNQAKRSLDQLGLQGRVYARLHWDKDLSTASLDLEIQDADVVVLKGTVPSAAAKEKAELLTRDTLGVRDVVNRLMVQ
jgi:osmotically-inducible protein OsmY